MRTNSTSSILAFLSGSSSDKLEGFIIQEYINDLVQDCSNSIADILELLHSCTKPPIYVTDPFKYDQTEFKLNH